ncbi:MAG: type I-MYXAN CRISPR-associated Cas8a1/Cmx1 [Desulfobaccales bacterium]
MPKKSLTLKLFDPGMTHLHRVGLAGLYMTLQRLDPAKYAEVGGWDLKPQSVELHWTRNPRDLLAPIIEKSFGISQEGIIQFSAHTSSSMGDLNKLMLHRAILRTYLQFRTTRKLAAHERGLTFEFDTQPVVESIKPILNYQNQSAPQHLFAKNGDFKNEIKLPTGLFPGGVVRHWKHGDHTALTADPGKFLSLLYAPIGSLYFLISHKDRDGKYDKRKGAALVLPHLNNLAIYAINYSKYLASPVQRLFVDGLGDAGLMALTILNLARPDGLIDSLEINSCTIVTLGTVSWASQQKTRTGLKQVRSLNTTMLNFFDLAWRTLRNRPYITENGNLIVGTSPVRGLLADNIAAGLPWYQGFYQLMISQKSARQISFEREGVHTMVEQAEWPEEADQLLVKAMHQALRNRYGALAQRAKERGETPAFDREFERIRTSLMRSKNASTLRAELADIFARGGLNQTLQEHWPKLLPLFTGSDWQRARDLALLALASYAGKGAETITITEKED